MNFLFLFNGCLFTGLDPFPNENNKKYYGFSNDIPVTPNGMANTSTSQTRIDFDTSTSPTTKTPAQTVTLSTQHATGSSSTENSSGTSSTDKITLTSSSEKSTEIYSTEKSTSSPKPLRTDSSTMNHSEITKNPTVPVTNLEISTFSDTSSDETTLVTDSEISVYTTATAVYVETSTNSVISNISTPSEISETEGITTYSITRNPGTTSVTMSEVELQEILRNIRRQLQVNKLETSRAKRRLNSSDDPRSSSTGIGVVGMALLFMIIAFIIWSDMLTLGAFIWAKLAASRLNK